MPKSFAPKLLFVEDGASFQTHEYDSGVAVNDLVAPPGRAELTLPAHSINIVADDVDGTADWHGNRLSRRVVPAGGVTFLPAKSTLIGHSEHSFRATVITLAPDVFERASAGMVDMNQADLRYDVVSDGVSVGLANSLNEAMKSPVYRAWPMLIESMSASLAMSIIASMSTAAAAIMNRETKGLDDARKKRVLAYIEDNLHRPMTVSELAGVAIISQFHFMRMFKHSLGMSPLAYVYERRVKAAKILLRSGTMQIAQIAAVCGFSSQSHMTTVFKRLSKVSPGKYRAGTGCFSFLMPEWLLELLPYAAVA